MPSRVFHTSSCRQSVAFALKSDCQRLRLPSFERAECNLRCQICHKNEASVGHESGRVNNWDLIQNLRPIVAVDLIVADNLCGLGFSQLTVDVHTRDLKQNISDDLA